MLEVFISMPSLVGLRFQAPCVGQPKTLSFLSVCLSVCLSLRHGCERTVSAHDFAKKYRNDFDTIGYGKVCSRAPVLKYLRLLPIGDTTKCQSPKYGIFRRQRARE